MNATEAKAFLEKELPQVLQSSPEFTGWLQNFIRQITVSPESFDARFDRFMNELAADREQQRRHWDEQELKWEAQNRKWEEQNAKWEEQNRKWEEQNRKWDETLLEIRSMRSRHEQSIGALGARWGIASETSFRNALAGILKDSFGVEVINVNEFDDEGEVFGRPDQVELDVIIRNGTLILCELKSSMSRSDIYTFERKVRFYEKRHQKTASRRIVVSPMVDAKAQEVAKKLNIEIFSFAEDAK